MDGIQGAVLSVKLKHLPEWTEARRRNAALYNILLAESGNSSIHIPVEVNYAKHVYHVYAIRIAYRDALIEALRRRGIHCGIHYPVPIHLTEAYRFLNYEKGSFPNAETCADQFVSLPLFPEMTAEQIQRVAKEVSLFLKRNNH